MGHHYCFANVKRSTERAGSHYFDDDTMRCFGTRTYEVLSTEEGSYVLYSDRDARGMFGHRFNAGRRYYRFVFVTNAGHVDRSECDALAPVVDGSDVVHGWATLDTARRYATRAYRARRELDCEAAGVVELAVAELDHREPMRDRRRVSRRRPWSMA